jgi:pyrimidine-nucleoside phosphorylase
MNIIDLIQKKASKKILTSHEIKFIIDGFVKNDIKDYQMSSLLMAIKINGMNIKELTALTYHMMNSGDIIDLSEIKGIKVDKHSTGGVGDKITIAVAPIIASCGGVFAKMSGRGLGHTGGTIDKLESIPGFKVELSKKEFIKQIQKINIAVISQTKNIVPADKLIYALRDVTGTVDSIPLIVSSIMSKKLATGSDSILLDIKYGNGSFMKNKNNAKILSNLINQIGKKFNKDVKTVISNMNIPLGNSIGNKNEILEAIKTLKGNGPKDFTNLVYKISSKILIQAKIAKNIVESRKIIKKNIKSYKAFETFKI